MARIKQTPVKREIAKERLRESETRSATSAPAHAFRRIAEQIKRRSVPTSRKVGRWTPSTDLVERAFASGCVQGIDPEHCVYRTLAEEAYRDVGRDTIGDLDLVRSSPTLKIYRKRGTDEYIAGVRGTYDKQDVIADAALAAGALRRTARYQADRDALAEFLAATPTARMRTASHSLGGAVARELSAEFGDQLRGGVTFNSAFGADQLKGPDHGLVNYYASTDPLGKLAKPFVRNLRVIDADHLSPLEAHKLSTFAS